MSKLDKKRRRHKLRQKANSKKIRKAKLRDKLITKREAEEEAKPKMSDKKGVAHSIKSNGNALPIEGIDRSAWGSKDE